MRMSQVSIFLVLLLGGFGTARAEDLEASEWRAAERTATGGQAWAAVAGIVLEGTVIEGGVPERFVQTIDLRDGRNRTTRGVGAAMSWTGCDSVMWVSRSGVVNPIDLPPLVADARSRAFVDRAGWRSDQGYEITAFGESADSAVVHYVPRGGSELAVSFNARTHLVSQAVIATDDGPLTIQFGDWRAVDGVKWPFRRVETTHVGEVTIFEIENARLLRSVPGDSLARPERSPRGRLRSGAPSRVPFQYAGSHFRVPVRFNGFDADVIFDTGGANYVSPEAARRFGLEITGGLNLSGVGESTTTARLALARTVALGSAEMRDQTVIVAPLPWPDPPGKEESTPVGVVGYEFLAEFRTTIDYPAQAIILSSMDEVETPLPGAVTIPFYSDGHSIYVEAEVDGQRGLFRLDTGDGGTITLFAEFAKAHGLDETAGEAGLSGGGVGGRVRASPITLRRFEFAGAAFPDLPAELSHNQAGAFASRSLAGNLGGGLLRCFRVTFDYPGRTITLEADPERLRDCVVPRKR